MISETAFAKVNLGLAVTARRGDGFHELDTIFARLTLADELYAETADSGFTLDIQADPGLPGAETLQVEDNLVLRAAAEFAAQTGAGGAHFRLTKRIPLAAGLGGGSADAAAALRLLARLYPAEAEGAGLPAMAQRLGSDVPFMLLGAPAAHGRGRGERLTALELPLRHLVLANPLVPVSAADAFAWLQNFSRRQPVQRIVDALVAGEEPRWQNALQAGVTREVPEIREVLSELRAEGLQGVLMSGSGSTAFGLAEDEDQAKREAISARRPDWWLAVDSVGGQLPRS